MANHGFVYVLGNPAMPGIYKIGMTDRSPYQRADELSGATAIPYPFTVLAMIPTDEALKNERFMHDRLSEYRCSDNREFFQVCFENLISSIREEIECPFLTADGCEELVKRAREHVLKGWPAFHEFHVARDCCRDYDLYPAIGACGKDLQPVIDFFEECRGAASSDRMGSEEISDGEDDA